MAKSIVDRYEVLEKAGEGTYGVVYKAVSRKDPGRLVAIKEMRHEDQEEGVPSSALREISLLLELDHPNVVRLFDVTNDLRLHRIYLTFEYLDVDLYRLMQMSPMGFRSNPRLVKYYLWQMLQGLEYLHRRRIIHRDLKPQNLLISARGNVLKLADFGLARAMGLPVRCLSPEVVTIWYRAPELLLGNKAYTAAVDIWSVGCIFAEMAMARPLFPGMKELDQVNRIFQVCGTPSEAVWPGVTELPGVYAAATLPPHRGLDLGSVLTNVSKEGIDLLKAMLVMDPLRRMTAKAALTHPYFADMPAILADPPQIGQLPGAAAAAAGANQQASRAAAAGRA